MKKKPSRIRSGIRGNERKLVGLSYCSILMMKNYYHNHIHERNHMKRYVYLFIAVTMVVCSVTVGQVVKKPEKPDHYFLTKLGNDTLAVEEFSIDSHEIQGTSIARAPR